MGIRYSGKRLFAPGKPHTDILYEPQDVGPDRYERRRAWIQDETGDSPAPEGYGEWDVEAARQNMHAEMERFTELKAEAA